MIAISHRLSAITDVDKIIVLNFGKIIEQVLLGTYECRR